MAQTNPFDSIATTQDDDGLLPGTRAVKPAPEMPEVKAEKATPAPKAESTDARKPGKVENWLPPEPLRPIFEAAAQKYDVPVNVLMALGHQESRYNPAAIGQETEWGRAKGIVQYLDGTAKGLGINPFDPGQAIPAAAKQLRERLDKGETMIDAVREHFAGPDRKKWGAKTAAYGDEVMAKAFKIGELAMGQAPGQPATQSDTPSDVPADWIRLTPEQAAEIEAKQASAETPLEDFGPGAKKEEPGFYDEYLANPLKRGWLGLKQSTMARGAAYDAKTLGVMGRIDRGEQVPPEEDVLGYQWMSPEQRAAIKQQMGNAFKGAATRTAELGKEQAAVPQDPIVAAASNAKSFDEWWQYFKQKPFKFIANTGVESLPAMAPGLVLGGVGGAATRSLTVAAAGMGAGSYAVDYSSTVLSALNDMGVDTNNADALAKAFSDPKLMAQVQKQAHAHAAVVGALDAASGGRAGATVVAGKTMVRKAANMAAKTVEQGALGAAGEAGGQVAQGKDKLEWGAIMGEFAGEMAGAPAEIAGAAKAKAMEALAARREQQQGQPTPEPQAQAQPEQPAEAQPAPQAAPEPEAQPAAQPQRANGPLNRSIETAAEQHAGEARVTATAPDGSSVAGKVAAQGQNEDGDLLTSIQGDDGQTYTFSDKDGVQLAPAAPAPSGPITASIQAAAEEHAANPVAAPEPQPQATQPAAPDYGAMSLEDLRARLKYIAGQAKASGGWNKMFIDARKQVEKAINAKTAEAKEASKPSEEPLSTGPFDQRSAANKMMLRHAEATGQPHEVVEADGKFTIQAIKEQSDAGADTAGRVPAVGNDAVEGAATAPAEPGDQQAGSARAAQPAQERAADPGAPAAGARPAVPGDGAPADAQPALTGQPTAKPARDEHAGKWFSTEDKARDYITKRKIGATHTVKQTGRVRFEVKPKELEARTTLADAQAKFERQDEEVRKAAESIAKRKAEKEAQALDAAANEAATSNANDLPEPTEAQIESGNYRKGHINVQGLDITVENPRGSTRSGTDPDGKAWSHTMSDHYGYIKRTTGADGEHVDVYVGPKPESDRVYVVDQIDQPSGKFDEHKVMLGYGSQDEAVAAYKSNFDRGWKVGPVKEMSADEFKSWLKDGDTSKAAAAPEAAAEAEPAKPKRQRKKAASAEQQQEAVTAEPQHQDAGAPPEPAIAEVVEESVEKAAKAERVKPSDMRKWLVDQIDKAIAEAPQPDPTITLGKPYTSRGKVEFTGKKGKVGEHGFVLVTVRQVGNGQWTMTATNGAGRMERIHDFKAENTAAARRMAESLLDRAYLDGAKTVIGEIKTVTFDVPGDGKFVAPNTPAELAAFKKRVLASPGFKDSRPASAPKEADETAPGPAAQAEPEQAAEPEPQAEPADELPAPKQRAYASRGGAKPKAEPTDKIADFGEKIGGAKKDIWTGFKDDLNAVADEDIAAQPLSKVWPAPDYQKLIDGGMDAEAVASVRALRDEVPAKPRAAWKVKRWAEQVKTLRDFANDVMDGAVSPTELRRKMLGIGLLRGVAGRIDLYLEVGHAKSLEGVRFQQHHYSIYRGQENVDLWVVEKDQAASAFSNWPREIATGKTREEAIADFKAKYASLDADKANKQASFDIFSERGVKAYFVGKKIGRNYAKLAGPFNSVKEARQYRDEQAQALAEKLEKFKEIPRERRDVNEPRVGEDMRNGQDVTPQMFADTFKFRGVEFGNWVEQKRRQQDLNDAFDALMDMAAVLGIKPAALSLNGQLGLAFGARGSGGTNPAAAHYEPGKIVINLTKRSGAGSLGHEWWHALDNYFSRMRSRGDQMMTEALDVSLAARGSDFIDNTPVRRQMINAFGDVVRAIKQTAIKARSAKLDAKRTKEYWTTGAEMSARAFESYLISKLQDQNASNDYLANIVSEETWAAAESLGFELDSSYPYPTAGEIPVIRAAFDRFFQTVETREEDGRPVLYSVADDDGAPGARGIPDAIVGGPLGDLSKHPDYAAAKAGDMRAAMRATRDVVTPALVQQVRDMAGDSNPIIQPVAAVEAAGKNRIPTAAAVRLHRAVGLPVGYGIVQSSSPKRTAMAGVDRLFARPQFDGVVEPGRSYILLDDTITQGGTFAALAKHIEAGGGHVLGIVALTGKQYSAKIALSDSTLNKVRELYGDIEHLFRAAAGHGFDALTESEARYLANFRPADAIRNRIVARGQQEGGGTGAQAAAGRGSRQGNLSGAAISPADAIPQLMAARSGEATITRDGIGTITIPYGDKEQGLAHIAARRGEAFMERLPDLLATGEVYPKDGQPDRIFIGNERDEAVIRTDHDGQPGNWLLTAYEKHPDLTPLAKESRTESHEPFEKLSEAELKSAITTGTIGPVIARLIEHGSIVIHRSARTLPKELGKVPAGVQALTMPDGTIHFVAGSLGRANARAVLLHEMFHKGAEAFIGSKEWANLMGRMGSLYRQSEQSSGKARQFYDRARERVAAAKAKGAVSTRMEVEEFAAYAIEEYERAPESLPAAIRKWVEDLIGMVKAYMLQRYGKQVGQVTPAQLSAFAKLAIMDVAAAKRGELFGPIGELFSVDPKLTVEVDGVRRPIENSKGQPVAPDMNKQLAFYRWFGDSKVVDDEGRPMVVYHGTRSNVSEFDPTKTTFDGAYYFTPQSDAADNYARNTDGDYEGGSNILPAYLSMRNPLVVDYRGDEDMDGLMEAVEQAKENGHDGVIAHNTDDGYGLLDQYVVFSPEQIKSATGNAGTFDPESADIRYSVSADTETPATTTASAEPPVLTPPEQGMLRRVQASIQDNMNRVRQVQDRIMELTGRTALGKSDYYGAETNRPGRIAARLEDARENLVKPLMEKLAKSGRTPEQLSSLLHAMHAKERNEAVAKINPEHDPASADYIGTQGSGMNDEVAKEILKQYAGDRELHALANEARAIAKATLDLKLAYGLIKPEDHETLSEMYEFYVPLKGDGEFGPKVKRAMGHTERDEHILENIARDYDQAVVVGEKNLARQSLLRMVLQFKDDDLWTARVPPRGRYVAGKVYNVQHNGKTVATFTSQSQVSAFLEGKGAEAANYTVVDSAGEQVKEFVKPLQDNEVMVYVKGEPVRIQIHDEQLARQLRPLNAGQLHPILEFFRTINQYLAKVYTGYNPAFILRNTARDAMTGTVNILGHEGAAVAAKAWAKYPQALVAMGRWAATKQTPSGKIGRYLTEYRMNGGKVGASYMSDLEQQGRSLQGMFDDARGIAATAKDGHGLRAGRVAWNKSVGRLAHVVEIANQATENALRLALYITLREEGASAGRAAQSAKQVTVDFDRKGATTGALGSLYLFFNPAIQGSANAIKTLAKGAHREQAWAALGGLALAGAWAASKGMGDDKDRWLGEEWSSRTKNFILNFGEHQLRIPLSQEFSPVYALGVALAEGWHGESKAKTSARVVSSFIDAYFPLQGAYRPDSDNHLLDLTLAGVPTVLKPLSEAAANRNSFGSQVVPENEFTKDRPDNLKMYRGTKNSAFDKTAQGIASVGELLGAGKYENDITKVSPETLKSLWRTYTGGLGQFVTDSVGLAGMMTAPSQVETGDVPIVKDFVRNHDARPLQGRYYDLADEAKAAITEFEQAKKAGDGAAAVKIMGDPDKARMIRLGRMVKATSKAAAALGDKKVSVNADPNLSSEQKRAKLKELEQREEALYRSALRVFQ